MFDLTETKENFKNAQEWLTNEFSSVHTGQATPSILDGIMVDSYGSMTPIKNIAGINLEDAKTLRVAPWDKGQIKLIEKAVTDADLGLSVVSDADGVRVIFPQLTEETRAKLAKVLKGRLEDARVTVRKERERVVKEIEGGDMSDDEKKRVKEEVQKIVDETNTNLDSIFKEKEKSVMTI